jgi:TetR/AcrR family transcriptional regulator, cholesterol catabolism regulator
MRTPPRSTSRDSSLSLAGGSSVTINHNVARFGLAQKHSRGKKSSKPVRPHHLPGKNGSKSKSGTRLEEVLKSAANIFFAKGFHATSIEDVARDVGMLKGSLYYYIKSKDDLLFQLLLAGIEDGDAYIAQHIDPKGDPVEQLERAIRAQIDYIIQNKVPFGLFLHEFDSLPGKRQHKLTAVMSRYNNRFVELVQKGQQQGKLMKGEPWMIVNGMLGMCNWLYRWYDADHLQDREQIKQIFLEVIFKGIRKA